MDATRSEGTRIVAVSLRAEAAAVGLESLLDRLARGVGRSERRTLILLPALTPSLAALGAPLEGRSLARATARAVRLRPLRLAAVRVAYPGADSTRRLWLAMHDRVHRVIRGPVGDLAERLGAWVACGTALLDHPRTHWEDWPDTGCLFHSTHLLGPDGEPAGVLRHPDPRWPILEGVHADRAGKSELGRLEAGGLEVALRWEDRELEAGPSPEAAGLDSADPGSPAILWAPRAWTRRPGGAPGPPAAARPERLLEILGTRGQAAVRTCLAGTLGGPLMGSTAIARRAPGGHVEVLEAEAPETGISWVVADLPEAGAT